MVTTPENEIKIFNAIKDAKPMVVVCSWCPDAREKTKAAIDAGHDVTHGMCPACTAKWEGR